MSLRPIVRLTAALALASLGTTGAEEAAQRRFASPTEAFRALVAAAKKHDAGAIKAILGPDSDDLVSSGDPVDDRAASERFVARAAEGFRVETLDAEHAIVRNGREGFPFAIPLAKDAQGWRFDAAAGREELLNRRIGRNELETIDAARAYVEAQREHASRTRAENGTPVYAQKIRSEAGKRDGLYWGASDGRDESPLGPLFAEASGEGYKLADAPAEPQPFHGYFFRILTAQGPSAPGGARSYVKDGRMSGGFALVAWPAEHGSSGVKTFIVGPLGIVYEKDLGEETAEIAKAMTAFDPDASWTPVR